MPLPRGTAADASLLEALEAGGCPACRAGERALADYVQWFLAEGNADPESLDRLRDRGGFCAEHSRALIEGEAAASILTSVLAWLVPHLAEQLARGALRPTLCPVCEVVDAASQRMLAAVLGLMGGRSERRLASEAYSESQGLCLVHLRRAIACAERPAGRRLLEDACRRLEDGAGTRVPMSTGPAAARSDPDLPRRHRLMRVPLGPPVQEQALPEGSRARAVLGALEEDLRAEVCPVCLAGERNLAACLDWLALRSGEERGPLEGAEAGLCSVHLWDLAARSQAAVDRFASFVRRQASVEMRRGLASAPAPSPGLRGRVGAGAGWRRAAAAAVRAPRCPACTAVATAEQREAELLRQAIALAPVSDALQRSVGLCLRHAREQPVDAAGAQLRTLSAAVLRMVSWELDEALRRQSWSVRYEVPGAEQTAWMRALGRLDGSTFCGRPPGRY